MLSAPVRIDFAASANETYAAIEAVLRDDRTTQRAGAIVRRHVDGGVERAPLAAAAALGVLAGGAAFLAFAMSRPTSEAPRPEAAIVAVKSEEKPSRLTRPASPRAALESGTAADAIAGGAAENAEDPASVKTAASKTEMTPRLKPGASPSLPIDAPEPGAGVLSLTAAWLADESDRPPPFFFRSDLERGEFAFRPHGSADGDIPSAPFELRVSLAKGENFVDLLKRAGVGAEDRNSVAYAFGRVYNLRRLLPGQEFTLTLAEPNRTLFQSISEKEPRYAHLIAMDFRADAERRIILEKGPDNAFHSREIATPLTTRVAEVSGRIDGSLYLSAKKQGAPDDVIAGLAQMFAYDVDFQREIFGGDEFEAIFEVRFDQAGNIVGGGDILFGRLKWRGRQREKAYYRFETAERGGKPDYFDAAGESARRLLMKTPIDGARLSSGFGTRKHPILGYQKAHKGVDFAAARGTPIMAAGDGVVERAGPYGSFGNYVRIRHAQGYKTAYAHMNAVKKGVRTGVRVRQGDVIGFVGSTGRSTGPHLHYEVHLKDVPVNPQSLKIATGVELSGKELERFKIVRDKIDSMRAPHASEEADVLADAKEVKKAL